MSKIIRLRTEKERKAYYEGMSYVINHPNQKENIELMLLIEDRKIVDKSKVESV